MCSPKSLPSTALTASSVDWSTCVSTKSFPSAVFVNPTQADCICAQRAFLTLCSLSLRTVRSCESAMDFG